jgi:hypothetical protein
MPVLSAAISVPLRSARRFTWLHVGAQATVALTTIVVGSVLIYKNAHFLAT